MAITEAIIALALSATLHQCCVCTDEHVRYQQLAMMEQERIAYSEEVGNYSEEWATTDWSYYDYYEPSYDYFDTEDGITAAEFMYYGVVEQDGMMFTWYSQNVLPGSGLTELNENGRHVEGGFVVDGDGYIALAQPGTTEPDIGMVVDTPFGPGKVYDCDPYSEAWDVYTNF